MAPTDPDPRPRRSPRGVVGILLAVVVLGLAAAGVAGTFAGSERQRAVQVVTSPATPEATAGPSPATPSPTTPPVTAPAVPVAPAVPSPAAAPSPTAPVRVVIPGRDVDVPVDPVGVAPGDPAGTTVVAAHVDSVASGGTGSFVHLVDVRPGDAVEVTLADGSARTYAVDAVTRFPEDEARWPDVVTRDGPPRLALVTCGGVFDRDTRHDVDDVLVTASPVGA